jgi:leucyl/phenylalanyl-tRNA---protein transferase
MTVYRLPEELVFPPPIEAEADGLLAVGGDLSPERLLLAYSQGIFPWPHEGWPMLWFSPDPRMILDIEEVRIQRSLRQSMRKGRYEIRLDSAFGEVVAGCKVARRPGQHGTWITNGMRRAYLRLHELGFAHSAEAWHDGKLAGGLYGVSLGRAFFGESMFALEPDASKVAFVTLVEQLRRWGFHFVDAQVHTPHLERFGARLIPREDYLQRLEAALKFPARRGPWRLEFDAQELLPGRARAR